MLTRFWTANGVKYENVVTGAINCNMSKLELRKGKTKVGKQGVHSLYEITKQRLNSDLENLISFSMIYTCRFIGLCHEIAEIIMFH